MSKRLKVEEDDEAHSELPKKLYMFLHNRWAGHPIKQEDINTIHLYAESLDREVTNKIFLNTGEMAFACYRPTVKEKEELHWTILCLRRLRVFPEIRRIIGRLIVAPLLTKNNSNRRKVMALNDVYDILSQYILPIMWKDPKNADVRFI